MFILGELWSKVMKMMMMEDTLKHTRAHSLKYPSSHKRTHLHTDTRTRAGTYAHTHTRTHTPCCSGPRGPNTHREPGIARVSSASVASLAGAPVTSPPLAAAASRLATERQVAA